MAEIITAKTNTVATPSPGNVSLYVDNGNGSTLRIKNENGVDYSIAGLTNYSIAAQSITAATRTYIVGSQLFIPTNKLLIGSCFKWKFNITKTAAGIAASTFDLTIGTTGSTTDVARIQFVKPAGTAVADEGWITIEANIRSTGVNGVVAAQFTMIHNLAATGHAVIPCVVVNGISAGFDTTLNNLIVGLCMTSGAGDAITIQIVQAQAWNI